MMATSITRRQIREAACEQLGLLKKITIDTVDTTAHTFKAADLVKKYPDAFHIQDAYLTSRETDATGSNYHRIIKWYDEETPDTIQLDSGPDDLADGEDGAIYELLSPEEWNDAINESLGELLHPVRITITLDTEDNNYAMDPQTDSEGDACTWIVSRTQIHHVDTKDVSDNIISETDWAGYKIIEDANGLQVHLTYIPQDATYLVVTVLKPYSRFAAGADELTSDIVANHTTTCPFQMAVQAAKVKAVLKMYQRHGADNLRKRFGTSLAIAERQLAQMKAAYTPAMRPHSMQIDETFEPDIPSDLTSPVW